MDVVYTRSCEAFPLAVFAELGLAESTSAERVAMRSARTWGDFRESLPPGSWNEIVEGTGWREDDFIPGDDEAFDPTRQPGGLVQG